MNRIDLLLNVLESTFDKEGWYPPLKHAIEGITAEQANWRPTGEAANTIWENLNHLIYYKERIVANLEGRDWNHASDNDATFHITTPSDENSAWKAVVARAEEAHHNLYKVIKQTSLEEMHAKAIDQSVTDIMLHDAYHTGQIIQIRKMQGSWPSSRSFN